MIKEIAKLYEIVVDPIILTVSPKANVGYKLKATEIKIHYKFYILSFNYLFFFSVFNIVFLYEDTFSLKSDSEKNSQYIFSIH